MSHFITIVGRVVEWLKRHAYDQHGLGSNPTGANLFFFVGKTLYGTFPCLVVLASSSETVLAKSRISIKLQADSNILASQEAKWSNSLPYILAPPLLSCKLGR